MKFLKIAPAVIACCALMGCKSDIVMPVATSSFDGNEHILTARLYAEVPSCQDSDTGLESNSVLQAKQQVQYALKDAEYCGCKKQGFDSITEFKFPLVVSRSTAPVNPDRLGVMMNKDGEIFFQVGKNVGDKFSKISDRAVGLDASSMKVRLILDNDSGKDQSVYIVSALIGVAGSNSKPVPAHSGGITQPKATKYVYTLSDVGSMFAINNGLAKVISIKDVDQ